MSTKEEKTQQKRQRLELRLELYYERERQMLTDGVKSYGIGSRNLQRYDTALKDIQEKIDALEAQIRELDARAPRKSVGIIPRDW